MISNDQLDHLAGLAQAATPGPWTVDSSIAYGHRVGSSDEADWVAWTGEHGETGSEADAEFIAAMNPAVAKALIAEVRRLRARVTELEEAGTYARSALAALCYDLEDPGSNALGALYEISRATTGVDTPRDDAAEALARHDADVIRKAAQVLEATDRDDDAVNLLYLLADAPAARSAAGDAR